MPTKEPVVLAVLVEAARLRWFVAALALDGAVTPLVCSPEGGLATYQGLAFDARTGTLFVASTADNAVFAIANAALIGSTAGRGRMIFQDPHLRGPLGLALAPNGDLIAANGDAVNGDPTQPSELVEFTPQGRFVGQFSVDPGSGGAFGLAVTNDNGVLRLAAVDDVTNSLEVWTFQTPRSGF